MTLGRKSVPWFLKNTDLNLDYERFTPYGSKPRRASAEDREERR